MGPAARLTALLLLFAGLAGCGGEHRSAARDPGRPAVAASGVAPAAVDGDRHLASGPVARPVPRPALPDPRTVRRALRRALLANELPPARHAAYRRIYRDARRTAARLPGTRRAELTAVLDQVRDLARRRRLSVSRMPQAFLTLQRNTRFWARAPLPAPGARFTFGRDPVILQAYPGHGLQVQPLASFGRANALARVCLDRAAGRPAPARCRPAALGRLLDRLVGLAARRGGIPAWEGWFQFARAAPGWVSGMTQATAVQALTRGAHVLHPPRYLRVAHRAVRLFTHAPPLGVAVPARGGRHFLMYSTLPGYRVFNGHLQAVTGLREYAVATGDRAAVRAYRRGERAARATLRAGDTGAWSLYSAGGAESSLSYHRLTETFLGNLCRATHRGAYCAGERRFARYLREPPRLRLRLPHRLRLGRATRVAFRLSKLSDVTIAVRDRRGLELRRTVRLPRGRHSVGFRPRRAGRVRVTVAAVGLSGTRGACRHVRGAPPAAAEAAPSPPSSPGRAAGAVRRRAVRWGALPIGARRRRRMIGPWSSSTSRGGIGSSPAAVRRVWTGRSRPARRPTRASR